MAADPVAFLRLTMTRLRELFLFWPTTESSLTANTLRVLSFGLLVPFVVAGFLWRLSEWRQLAPIYLFVGTHVGIHAVTWSMVRYRVPLDPFLILFASCALVSAWEAVLQPAARPLQRLSGGPS